VTPLIFSERCIIKEKSNLVHIRYEINAKREAIT
jgi:hypothetical protein